MFDNPITLAYRAKLKVRKFEHYNDLRGDHPIVAGEIYYLQKKSKRAAVPFHVVRRGQSLWAIAQQYGIYLRKLIEYNDINPEQQPAVARILWLQRKRPDTVPIEYYRAPKQPDGPQLPKTTPVFAGSPPDLDNPKPAMLKSEPPVKSEELPPPVPNRSSLASLDSLIAALNKQDLSLARSGATKMLHAPKSPERAALEKEPEEVNGPLIVHIAEKTDTYATVARKYNVTIQQLYRWNNVSAWKPLRAGQSLLIDQSKSPGNKGLIPQAAPPTAVKPLIAKPVARKAVAAKPVPTKPAEIPMPIDSASEIIHVVRAGENMYRIGLRYKVRPTQIQQWNNLPDLTAVVGARLVIRKK